MGNSINFSEMDLFAIAFGIWISNSGYLQAGGDYWSHAIRKDDEMTTSELYIKYLNEK